MGKSRGASKSVLHLDLHLLMDILHQNPSVYANA